MPKYTRTTHREPQSYIKRRLNDVVNFYCEYYPTGHSTSECFYLVSVTKLRAHFNFVVVVWSNQTSLFDAGGAPVNKVCTPPAFPQIISSSSSRSHNFRLYPQNVICSNNHQILPLFLYLCAATRILKGNLCFGGPVMSIAVRTNGEFLSFFFFCTLL